MAGRGQFTDPIKAKMDAFMGRETTQAELRLLPYIHYTMVNSQRLDPNHVSPVERGILKLWREAGLMEGGASGMSITRAFWDFISEMMWDAYIAHGDA